MRNAGSLILFTAALACIAISAAAQPAVESESFRSLSDSLGVYEADGSSIATAARIAGVRDYLEHDIQEIFQNARVGMSEYRFRLPNGRYRVHMYFAEIEKSAVGERVFSVKLQGEPVVEGLDLFAEVGANHAYQVISGYVQVSDGQLSLEFEAIAGEPLLSAISIDGEIAEVPPNHIPAFFQHMNCGGPNFHGFRPDFGFDARPPG